MTINRVAVFNHDITSCCVCPTFRNALAEPRTYVTARFFHYYAGSDNALCCPALVTCSGCIILRYALLFCRWTSALDVLNRRSSRFKLPAGSICYIMCCGGRFVVLTVSVDVRFVCCRTVGCGRKKNNVVCRSQRAGLCAFPSTFGPIC